MADVSRPDGPGEEEALRFDPAESRQVFADDSPGNRRHQDVQSSALEGLIRLHLKLFKNDRAL